MKGARTGVGIVFGAALGLLFGQLLFDGWWIGPMVGVAAGLIIGAITDLGRPAGALGVGLRATTRPDGGEAIVRSRSRSKRDGRAPLDDQHDPLRQPRTKVSMPHPAQWHSRPAERERTVSATASTSILETEPPAVEVEHLTKRYGATLAVDDLSFSIPHGTIAGFLGPNGAGKTTTFRMLVGLAAPTSGTAHVLGEPYSSLSDPIHSVGAMLEVSGHHPARTARNHLLLLARTAGIPGERVNEMLDLVELEEAADRAVGGFSSGMRQRLGLAAALLGDPGLLLLDEPANGLDPKGIRWLRGFLRWLAHENGKTVFVSSHVLAEVAQMVDEVVIINRGRLITQGPTDTVVAHMGRTVMVRSPDAAHVAKLLEGQEVTVTQPDDDRLVVSGIEIEEVGRLAAANNVVLYELREQGLSLEETFLALTEQEGES